MLIAGPCALESEDLCREVAAVLAKIKAKHRDKIEVVFDNIEYFIVNDLPKLFTNNVIRLIASYKIFINPLG